jgi:hypothetical protein
MPLLKDLYPEFEIDYSDGFDLEGVEIPAHVMQKILEQIPPDELTVKRLANECYEYGIMKRDEVTLINAWAEEAALKQAQEFGRMGRKKANAGFNAFWEPVQHDANQIWKRRPTLSVNQVAEMIAKQMKRRPPEEWRTARTIRGKIKKPKQI